MAKVEITGIHLTHGAALAYQLSIAKSEINFYLSDGEEPDALAEFFNHLLEAEGATGVVVIVPEEEAKSDNLEDDNAQD